MGAYSPSSPPRSGGWAFDPSGRYAAGAGAIGGIVTATEREVQRMLARADEARSAASAEARRRILDRVAGDRVRLAAVRSELAGQAAAVNSGFVGLLALLDEADRRLASPEDGFPSIEEELASIPLRPREGTRATAAGEAEQAAPEPEPEAPPAPPNAPRRRWWHRWIRPAA